MNQFGCLSNSLVTNNFPVAASDGYHIPMLILCWLRHEKESYALSNQTTLNEGSYREVKVMVLEDIGSMWNRVGINFRLSAVGVNPSILRQAQDERK